MEKQKKNYYFLNLFLILEVKEEKKKINEETFCVLHRFQRLCIIILMILATKKKHIAQ